MPRNPNKVSVVAASKNSKTGLVAATYAPISKTCPKSCSFYKNGCYAQDGFTGMQNRQLERNAKNTSPLELALIEARKIRELDVPPGRPLRLHVTGDCTSIRAAQILASAAKKYPGPVWGYTHNWRKIPRSAWGTISIFASCENLEQAQAAIELGYPPALVVAQHPENGKAWRDRWGWKWVPCPEQTRGVQCVSCRLCFDPPVGVGIAFAAHGRAKHKVLKVVS